MDNNSDGKLYNETGSFHERLEKALKVYKMSELYLKDVEDDYGKLKIARLRFDFARHELSELMEEAAGLSINLGEMEIFKDILTFENNELPGFTED